MDYLTDYIEPKIDSDLSEPTELSAITDQAQATSFITDVLSPLRKSKLFDLCIVSIQSEVSAGGFISPFIMSTTYTEGGEARAQRLATAKTNRYMCSQVNFDVTIRQSSIDAYSSVRTGRKFLYLGLLKEQLKSIPTNMVTGGFYGKYEAETSDPIKNLNGEDVKQGWIAKIIEKGMISYSPDVNGSYESHNNLALKLKSKIKADILNNTSMICVVGDGFSHDGIENEDLFLVPTKKTLGNLPTYYIKNMPRGHMMITAKRNLKIIVQMGTIRVSPLLIKDSQNEYASLLSFNMDYSIGDLNKTALLILGDEPTLPNN